VNTPNTLPCSDDDRCTTMDGCRGGMCAGMPVICPPGQVCRPQNGMCRDP
jgi:hypothetical protein